MGVSGLDISENGSDPVSVDAPGDVNQPKEVDEEVKAQDEAVYEVQLTKGVCGLGIYFTASASGAAIVDPAKPFYRLPDGYEAPGEASGVISAGDRLLAINEADVATWHFPLIVEELRRIPLGRVTLRFVCTTFDSNLPASSATPSAAKRVRWKLFTEAPAPPPPHEEAMTRAAAMEVLLLEMETRVCELEEDVEREKKCRFLSERKNILYRNAFRAVSEENAQLRYQLALVQQHHTTSVEFQESLEMGI